VKRLILIRHAKSSWKEPGLADFDRPLNRRGKEDAPLMGRRLAGRGELPELIITSPAKRAVSTVNRIAREIGFPKKKIQLDPRLYGALASDLLGLSHALDNTHGCIMLCGHNPGLTEFANLVSAGHLENIPTCGIVIIEVNVQSWTDVSPGSGTICHFDYPKRSA
jgi:phosphohistidine phosphatase